MAGQMTTTSNFTFMDMNRNYLPQQKLEICSHSRQNSRMRVARRTALKVRDQRGHSLTPLPHSTHVGHTACRSRTWAWWRGSPCPVWLQNCPSVCLEALFLSDTCQGMLLVFCIPHAMLQHHQPSSPPRFCFSVKFSPWPYSHQRRSGQIHVPTISKLNQKADRLTGWSSDPSRPALCLWQL